MRTYDFTPYGRSTVGFDRMFDLLSDDALFEGRSDYPPYNIERTGEDRYRITLAVAGFAESEISITAQQNHLIVSGQMAEAPDREYLHKGIAARPFEHRFSLEDHVEVQAASLENGLLEIDLFRNIPEAMKTRRIEIGSSANGANGKSASKKEIERTG